MLFQNIRFLSLSVISVALLAPQYQSQNLELGLTEHFKSWLNQNGYGHYGFDRSDLVGGAFGGKPNDVEESNPNGRKPVVFFHGNSDIAVGVEGEFTGFTESIKYFMSQGYTKSDLYITTWGPGNKDFANKQVHSKEYLTYLRAFTEAVLVYTGAPQIDVISHSMGVTLGRRVIKGGKVVDEENPFDLGPSLASKVDTFVGIAGANWGLTTCYELPEYQTCNELNGFYPGYAIGPLGLSKYLKDLNDDKIKEASYTYALLSQFDDLIGYGDLVWGRYTSEWPTMDKAKVYESPEYTHMHLRDHTKEVQFNLITKHSFTLDEESLLFLQ